METEKTEMKLMNKKQNLKNYYDALAIAISDSEYADVSTSTWKHELDFNNDIFTHENEEVSGEDTLNALFW